MICRIAVGLIVDLVMDIIDVLKGNGYSHSAVAVVVCVLLLLQFIVKLDVRGGIYRYFKNFKK